MDEDTQWKGSRRTLFQATRIGSEGMNTKWESHDGAIVATVDGRVDGANAHEFQEALEAVINASESAVILDFAQLTYISSAGLRVVLLAAKELRKQDKRFAVCSLAGSILEVFKISGFDQIIPVHASQAEALATVTA